jgi:hypothetical protein
MFDRMTAGLAIGRAEADAAAIARYLHSERSAELNERTLYQQQGWSWLRDGERRASALRVLSEAGWIRQQVGGRGAIGRFRRGCRRNRNEPLATAPRRIARQRPAEARMLFGLSAQCSNCSKRSNSVGDGSF